LNVQGTSIELVITYLRKWLRIERTHVGRLLWSYPLDYSLPRLVMPLDATSAESTIDEPPSDVDTGSAAAAASTAQASSSNSSDSDGNSGPKQQPQQPKQVPMWGAAEACSWLDINLRKGGSSGSNGSSSEDGGSGSDGSSNKGGAPDAGTGGGSTPPPAAA
jgi:hypothetical protein